MDKMVRYCRSRGTRKIVGQVLREILSLFKVVRKAGDEQRIGTGAAAEDEGEQGEQHVLHVVLQCRFGTAEV